MTDLVIVVKFRQCRLDEDCATMAEWLRRLTRNQMGSYRVGSKPTRSDFSVFSTSVSTCTTGGLVDQQNWETVL